MENTFALIGACLNTIFTICLILYYTAKNEKGFWKRFQIGAHFGEDQMLKDQILVVVQVAILILCLLWVWMFATTTQIRWKATAGSLIGLISLFYGLHGALLIFLLRDRSKWRIIAIYFSLCFVSAALLLKGS